MRKNILIGLLAVLSVLVLNSGFLFKAKMSASAIVNDSLNVSFATNKELKNKVEVLLEENEKLRSQLLSGQENAVSEYIKVYSSYPFNSRSEIAIAAGDDKGIRVGDAVMYRGNIFVGQVRDVFKNTSVVTTIFDPSWQMAVRIGDGEVDALMKGGNELTLSLIPQGEEVNPGDMVISADRNFLYGLDLGKIKTVKNTEGDVFQEATVEPILNIKDLRDVTVSH